MNIKWYKNIESFVSDLDEVGWFECFSNETAEEFKESLLDCVIDPKQYYSIPITDLGFYMDLELEFSYTEWIEMFIKDNRNIIDLKVIDEKELGKDKTQVEIEIEGKKFITSLNRPCKWMDPRVIDFLRESIEVSLPSLTLTSLNGYGQDPILCIMRKDILEKCNQKNMFPNYEGADRDIEEMMYE